MSDNSAEIRPVPPGIVRLCDAIMAILLAGVAHGRRR